MKFIVVVLIILSVISAAFGIEQIRQCTCNEQHQCFEQMKDRVAECLDECVDRHGMQSIMNASSQWIQCLDMRKRFIFSFYDCIDNQCSMKDSCLKSSNKEESKKIKFTDFEGMFLKHVVPLVEKTHQQLREFYTGLDITFVQKALDIDTCSRECAWRKLHNLQCFSRQKCELNVHNDEQVIGSIRNCMHSLNPMQRFYEVCHCFQQNGASDVEPFCQKLHTMQIPEEF